MTDPRQLILDHLRRFARREQRLLGLSGLACFVVVVAGGWLLAVVALNLGVRPPSPLAIGVLVAACAGAAWHWRALPRAAELRRQAMRAESLRPALAGELLTVLDRTARPMGSAALVDRMARRVAVPVETLPPAEAVPARPAGLWVLAALAATGLLLASSSLPLGPSAVMSAFRGAAAPGMVKRVETGPRAVVGDITLRYLFPTYTQLSPLEVPNSNGEVHAPPGTRIEVAARAERAWSSAVLEAFGAEEPAEASPDRGWRAAFSIPTKAPPESVWRFHFEGEGVRLPSPDYRVIVDPDLAPEVTVDVQRNRVAAAVDQPVGFPWHVHDDYGIGKVVVEVREGDAVREVTVREPANLPRDLDDRLSLTPQQLGLKPGSSAELRIKAWDNDEVSGVKAGWSAAIHLEVSGGRGGGSKMLLARRELRDALVLVLADFLLDPEPMVTRAEDAASWAKRADDRYEAVDALLARSWSLGQGVEADRMALRELEDHRRALLSLVRGLPARIASADTNALVERQRAHLVTLEGAILLFDRMVQQAALAELTQVAAQMAAEAGEMRRDFEKVDAANAAAAMARLDQLERMLRTLKAAAAQMGETSLAEFANQGADRLSDMIKEAQRALREGRFDDAKQLMDRIAEQMQELADGLDDLQERQKQGDNALGEAMKSLDKKLEVLQADQAKLRERTEAAREKFGGDLDQAQAVWEQIEALARSASTASAGIVAAAGPLGGVTFRGASDLRAEADGLLDAARSRNGDRTRGRAESVAAEANSLSTLMRWAGRDRAASPGAVELGKSIPPVRADAERIVALLDKLAEAQASPKLQEALEQLATEQRQISERAGDLQKEAESVARNLPMKAPGLERGTEQATEEAERAAKAMGEGDAMSASGGQQAAGDGIQEARDALKQAQQAMQSMAQSGGAESGSGEQGGEPRGGDQGRSSDMPLPAPEQFDTPEAYRRALLEGMQGEVPDSYRSSNLRYYEELVRQ